MNEREELRSMDVIPDEVKDYKNKTSNQEDESQSIEELERKHFQRIVNVFRSYKFVFYLNIITHSEIYHKSLCICFTERCN